jgi:hypothetical protein
VPEKLLDGPDVHSLLQKMRGKRMPERVTGRAFGDARASDGLSDRALQSGRVPVIPEQLPGSSIRIVFPGWKDPLPGPFRGRTL